MNKILTPQEAKQKAMKPWLDDIEQLRQECKTAIDNVVRYMSAKSEIELNLLRADTCIRFGEIDDAFRSACMVIVNPVVDPQTANMVIGMLHATRDKLSNNFVDNNEELCNDVIALLDKVKTNKVFNKKQCNEIINRLYQKVVSNETVNEVEQKEETQT